MSSDSKKGMSKIGFILSAIGAAVGLGNLWGFPTKMMSYGGPAFLIPYVVGVVLLGLPFLILEINLGSKWRKAPASFYGNYMGGFGKSFAWLQASVQLLIGTYYAVIISWVLISIGISFTDSLGQPGYFSDSILGTTAVADGKSFAGLGKIQPLVFVGFLVVLLLSAIIVSFGIDKGIERANKVMVPFLFLLVIGIFVYSLTLNNASEGLEAMFKPNIKKILDLGAWRGAFSQAFFTLSLAVSVIIVYSIHSPKDGDNTNRAITIMSGDTLIALLACVIIACTLGYSLKQGIAVEGKFDSGTISDTGEFIQQSSGGQEHFVQSSSGTYYLTSSITSGKLTTGEVVRASSDTATKLGGSAFVFKMFPQTFKSINQSVSGLGNALAAAFYLAVFFAAMSSMISLLEPAIANFQDAHEISRFKGVIAVSLIQFIFGIPFVFQSEGSASLMDLTDGVFTGYLLLISAFLTGMMVAWSGSKTQELIDLNNKSSMYKLGIWYRFLILFGCALILAVFVAGLVGDITSDSSPFIKYNTFQWILMSACYFVPFSVLVFGYGFSHLWNRLVGGEK